MTPGADSGSGPRGPGPPAGRESARHIMIAAAAACAASAAILREVQPFACNCDGGLLAALTVTKLGQARLF